MELSNLTAAFENEAKDAVEYGHKTLEHNWINKEVKVCKNCHGHKFDPEDFMPCVACDGTGADMIVEYGVEDGRFVSRVTQNGMEALKAVCREYRELEASASLSKRANRIAFDAYKLPLSAQLELEFMYPEFKQLHEEGDHKKSSKYVRRHYPEFMCTSYLF